MVLSLQPADPPDPARDGHDRRAPNIDYDVLDNDCDYLDLLSGCPVWRSLSGGLGRNQPGDPFDGAGMTRLHSKMECRLDWSGRS